MTHFVQPEVFVPLGIIQKAKGLAGRLVIRLLRSPLAFQPNVVFVYLCNTYVPYRVVFWNGEGYHAEVLLCRVRDRDTASSLREKRVFVADELAKGLFCQTEYKYVGYMVTDVNKGDIGAIIDVHKDAIQTLLEISYKGKSLLVPLHDTFVKEVNDITKEIAVDLPETYLPRLLS